MNKFSTLLSTSALVLMSGLGQADDTDIYYSTTSVEPGAEPMVMFSLDWRPNLGSTACGGSECDFLKNELDSQGRPYLAYQDSYTYFDMLRAVLRKVMDPLQGIQVGLMLNHDYNNNCEGNVTPGCSNGGYIGLGFESFQAGDANGAKEEFHTFLSNMPTPQGNASHKYQGKELFFELFRYLTGQGVLNGHVGYLDYNGYPETVGGTDPDSDPDSDPDPDPGTPITETVCETAKIKGIDTDVCADVTYNPSTETYTCTLNKQGSSYSMDCTVSALPSRVATPLALAAAGSSSNDINLDVENPSISWDTDIESGDDYISPLTAGGRCSKIFTVNVMFQVAQQEADSDDYISASKVAGGTGLSLGDFPAMIEYMNDADLAGGGYGGSAANLEGTQNVTSYFIVDETKINTKTRGYAQAGGTGEPLALSEDPEELVRTLEDVFKQILSVSTTFVSASVPVNAFNRAEVIDNVYLALFKADADAKAVWTGNVKKMKFAEVADSGGDRQLVDVYGDYAVAADGRVRHEALTFWTDKDALPPIDPDSLEVTGRDGRSTTRGGAGQKIPGLISGSVGLTNADGGRTLFYDDGTGLADLDADTTAAAALQGALGAASEAEALELLKYARGFDIYDSDGDTFFDDTRPWLLGDPLHSRPLPINYGETDGYDEENQAIYIAFGANDGFMHFIRNTTRGGAESGEEVWAFMPQEVMGELKTLSLNAAGGGHPYLVDGAPAAYVEGRFIDRALTDESVYLYFGLRRGGKALYAMDISDPEVPELAWKITKGGDFSELGYTFSSPVVGEMRVDTDTTKPIVMFGGGYDMNKDLRVGVGTDDTEGNAIYIADAETGELIWKAVGSGTSSSKVFVHPDLEDSIPSQVAAMDADGDQVTDRIYVGDTGGRVWRADIAGSDTSEWKLTLLADLGRHAESGKSNDRRFFHPPDIVQHKDSAPFDAVVIGSGDRPDPLGAAGAVNNYVYMIKDRSIGLNTGAESGLEPGEIGDVTNTCITAAGGCTANLNNGWRLGLDSGGEMSLATPLTIGGVTYFTTYLPPGTSGEGSCGPDEGSGRLWAVSLDNASAVNNYDTTTEELERYDELDSKGIPSEVISLPPDGILKPDLSIEKTEVTTRIRTFWLEKDGGEL